MTMGGCGNRDLLSDITNYGSAEIIVVFDLRTITNDAMLLLYES